MIPKTVKRRLGRISVAQVPLQHSVVRGQDGDDYGGEFFTADFLAIGDRGGL